jgi:hypothetical protein
VEVSCENGDEPSGSIKGRKFLEQLSVKYTKSRWGKENIFVTRNLLAAAGGNAQYHDEFCEFLITYRPSPSGKKRTLCSHANHAALLGMSRRGLFTLNVRNTCAADPHPTCYSVLLHRTIYNVLINKDAKIELKLGISRPEQASVPTAPMHLGTEWL